MPIDVKALREHAPATTELPNAQREILNLLRDAPGKAYTFNEIADELVTVRGTQAILPWNPLLVGYRTFNLATSLEELNRSGLVIRTRNAENKLYYHLPNGSR
ncbi:MAG: hypothetical protein KGJ23_12525 [Euryarchaeota archaeon]|nr:hypothetical protein [Euryarchaeota archaeon]MDE1837423.1 hypothetical protein [Euryarchaeota archaeon]MDE1881948.1 hypothetical protein [Euryarchaeota archaeon]MDE2045611.1 hypothetical protein [Thermoplasmata archaeon]